MTATPLRDPRPVRRSRSDLDLAPVTVLALTWLAALIATSVTLFLLVNVVGSFATNGG